MCNEELGFKRIVIGSQRHLSEWARCFQQLLQSIWFSSEQYAAYINTGVPLVKIGFGHIYLY